MRSELHSQTARINGAKSRGPTRRRSTHGMLSKTIVIQGEDPARFAALLNTLREELKPRTPIEESLVEDLATYRWRQRRLLCMETACFTQEIRLQDPEAAAGTSAGRATTAFTTLTSSSRTLDLLHRYELRFNREFNRTLQRLKALRGTGPENG